MLKLKLKSNTKKATEVQFSVQAHYLGAKILKSPVFFKGMPVV